MGTGLWGQVAPTAPRGLTPCPPQGGRSRGSTACCCSSPHPAATPAPFYKTIVHNPATSHGVGGWGSLVQAPPLHPGMSSGCQLGAGACSRDLQRSLQAQRCAAGLAACSTDLQPDPAPQTPTPVLPQNTDGSSTPFCAPQSCCSAGEAATEGKCKGKGCRWCCLQLSAAGRPQQPLCQPRRTPQLGGSSGLPTPTFSLINTAKSMVKGKGSAFLP